MAAFDEKEYTKAFDWSIWKRLLPVVARFKVYMIGMIVINALSAAVDVCLPLFQKYAIANFIEAGTLDGLVPFVASYVVAIVLQSVLVVLVCRRTMSVEMYLGRDLRRDLFERLQTLSLSFYNVTPVGYLLTRVMNDTNRSAGNIAWGVQDMAEMLFYVVGTFVAMLMLNWRLAWTTSQALTRMRIPTRSIPWSPTTRLPIS